MMKELTAEDHAKLLADAKANAEYDKKRCAKQQDTLDRLMSIISDEEKSSLPATIIGIICCLREWCPATRDMAIALVKDMIGEDDKMREYKVKKWKKFWDDNLEIHF